MPTNYTLDINTGLTQVLAEGTHTYLYGQGRIAQEEATTEYFLGDALSSVRQLVDGTAEETLTQSYEPFGSVISSIGDGESLFQFTGASRDSYIKLLYLRSRYMSVDTGRFVTKDVWPGNVYTPLSLNSWNYTSGNPINFSDPSGMIAEGEEAKAAEMIVKRLSSLYNIRIRKDWGYLLVPIYEVGYYPSAPIGYSSCWMEGNWKSLRELELIEETLSDLLGKFNGTDKFFSAMGYRPVHIARKVDIKKAGLAIPFIDVWLDDDTFYFTKEIYSWFGEDEIGRAEAYSKYTIAHELGHIWDIRELFDLSFGLGRTVGTVQQMCSEFDNDFCINLYFHNPYGSLELAPGNPQRLGGNSEYDKYAYDNSCEDWAEAFASYIYSKYWSTRPVSGMDIEEGGIRWSYVKEKIDNLPWK